MTKTPTPPDPRPERARQLGLHGLLEHWDEIHQDPWVDRLLDWETEQRQRRSLKRRLDAAGIGRFKPMADFDWQWPRSIDREQVDDLFSLRFVHDAHNVVLVGPNGVGKSMIAQNLAHRAVLAGHTVRFTTASALLGELAAQDGAATLQRRMRRYTQPALLAIDELGYLSFDHRYADLLFDVVTRRYNLKSVLITTNKTFADWGEVFPNASCVVTLVDRLVHHADIVSIDADSYRLKEAQERAALRDKERAARRRPAKPSRER
jgi:DNA replication protein DnaC